MKNKLLILKIGITAFLILPVQAFAETVFLEATQDNTLYESPSGRLSNGAGDHFFVGTTSNLERRRAVVAFKNIDGIPEGATVTSTRLHLFLSRQNSGPTSIDLHRVTRDWGEGRSDASENEGRGANSEPNDATWVHRFWDLFMWTRAGGDFVDTPSDTIPVDNIGSYTFGPTEQMISDVQTWVDDSEQNFGWILIGDETARSSKRFDSKDHPDADVHPVLEITYSTTGTPWDYSGPWYDPALDGEGYLVFQTPAGWLIYYFGYSADSEFLWLVSEVLPLDLLVPGEPFLLNMKIGEPGTFEMPTPSTELSDYGTLSVTFESCDAGVFVLDGLDGTKTSNVVKIIGVDGTDCEDSE